MPVAPPETKYKTRLDAVSQSDIDRFKKFERVGDCAVWSGETKATGYGRFRFKGKRIAAHRFAWLAWRGDLVDGMVIDHICRNRACVNPQHLQQVDPITNTIMGLSGGYQFMGHLLDREQGPWPSCPIDGKL